MNDDRNMCEFLESRTAYVKREKFLRDLVLNYAYEIRFGLVDLSSF